MPVELVLQGRAAAILFAKANDPPPCLCCESGGLRELMRSPDQRSPVGVGGAVATVESGGAEPLEDTYRVRRVCYARGVGHLYPDGAAAAARWAAAQAPSISPSAINTWTRIA